MKNNIVKIVVGVILIIFILFLIFKTGTGNKPFNKIDLVENNFIRNETLPSYYDTILSVAMSESGLVGQNVLISELSSVAKNQFDGDLKAHLRYSNNIFYLFIEPMDRDDAIEVLSHEVIHMLQYSSGNLSYLDGKVTWMGEVLDLNSKEYLDRPWENEAFRKQSQLIEVVRELLWENK